MEILGPELVKVAAILAAMERVSSVPRASGGQVTRLGLGVSIVHLYPLDPVSPQSTNKSLVTLL
jgi:hypothetical protein